MSLVDLSEIWKILQAITNALLLLEFCLDMRYCEIIKPCLRKQTCVAIKDLTHLYNIDVLWQVPVISEY